MLYSYFQILKVNFSVLPEHTLSLKNWEIIQQGLQKQIAACPAKESADNNFNGLLIKIKQHCDGFIITELFDCQRKQDISLILITQFSFSFYFSSGSAFVAFQRYKMNSLPITLCIWRRKLIFTLVLIERNTNFSVK